VAALGSERKKGKVISGIPRPVQEVFRFSGFPEKKKSPPIGSKGGGGARLREFKAPVSVRWKGRKVFSCTPRPRAGMMGKKKSWRARPGATPPLWTEKKKKKTSLFPGPLALVIFCYFWRPGEFGFPRLKILFNPLGVLFGAVLLSFSGGGDLKRGASHVIGKTRGGQPPDLYLFLWFLFRPRGLVNFKRLLFGGGKPPQALPNRPHPTRWPRGKIDPPGGRNFFCTFS